MAFVAATVAGTVADRLNHVAGNTQAIPAPVKVQTGASNGQASATHTSTNVAGAVDRIIADRLAMVGARVAAAEKQANDPAAVRDCHRRALLFHLFIVGVLLALLWVGYLGLKLIGNDDDTPASCPGCRYAASSDGSHYPWSLALQLIATVALLQSVVAHYVSTAPCRKQVHWSYIVIGNLLNVVVFAWIVWLIIAVTTPGASSAWVLVLTLFAGAAGCIMTVAAWLFCPQQQEETGGAEPCPEPSAACPEESA